MQGELQALQPQLIATVAEVAELMIQVRLNQLAELACMYEPAPETLDQGWAAKVGGGAWSV